MSDDECRKMYREMIDAFHAAPSPKGRVPERESRASLAEAEAVAVIHGWTTRILRTGHAATRLHAEGFAAEVSPLLRSMFEHVMALHWIRDQPGDAYQSLYRAWQKELSTFKQAESNGWRLTDEVTTLIMEIASVGTDETSRYVDYLLNTRARADRYGLGILYRSWLIESWTTHASLASASGYYAIEDKPPFAIEFFDEVNEPPPEVPLMCAAAACAALEIYNDTLPGQVLATDIATWRARLGPTFEATPQDDDSV